MNVFYFCSDQYASIASVSIISLLENNKTIDYVHFYIADDGIKDDTKSKLREMIRTYKADIHFIPLPDPSFLLDFPFKNRYQIGHSYPRMCIARLLPPNIDRILVLDSDTLILDDLGSLWRMDMNNHILAGVVDCVNLQSYKKQFRLSNDDLYCNAGVFLVDLRGWREHGIEDRIITAIRERNGKVFFFEQTLMNYSCRGRIIRLPADYNLYTLFYAFEYDNLITWRRPTVFYRETEILEAINHPKIVHFTRNFYMKSHPWKNGSEHPLTDVYRHYMFMTPWSDLWNGEKSSLEEKRYMLWHRIPQKILCQGANIIYNYIRPKMLWKDE